MPRSALGGFALLVPGIALALGVAIPAHAQGGGAAGVGEFRAKMDKWVEARKLISAEKSGWEADRETLQATRDLLAQQKEALQAEVAELEETSTAGDEERRELLLQRGEYQRARGALEERIRALEEDVLALAVQFPQPLQERLKPLLLQIPEDPEKAKAPLGQRLMNVLGVLSQAERFNGTATFVGETRAVSGDQKVQVRTLY